MIIESVYPILLAAADMPTHLKAVKSFSLELFSLGGLSSLAAAIVELVAPLVGGALTMSGCCGVRARPWVAPDYGDVVSCATSAC